VGEHLIFKLTEFTDEFGEPFRAGGFFATETPDMLALAEIETARADGQGTMILALVVVGQEEQ